MRLVAGRYAISAELGRGGMGVVWRAEDTVLGRPVALKELATPPGTNLERVMREARTAGRLNDPGVVTVYDVVREQGATFIVMELVVAPTLADVIGREGPLANDRVAALGLQVLGALESAHRAGIVHRDVKPSNIMVLPGDRVKLADFGIARAMDDPGLTQTGGVMGSPGYMAPELFAGAGPSPASDLWSLGATLFHAAEGRAPFQRTTTAATLHAIMYDQPVLERCRGPLAEAVRGLLTQATPDRLDASGLRRWLETARTAITDAPTQAVDPAELPTIVFEPVTSKVAAPTPTTADWDPPRKKRLPLVLAGAAVAVVAALAAIFLLKPGGTTPVADAGAPPASAAPVAEPLPGPTAAPSTSASPTPASASSAPPATSLSVLPGASTVTPPSTSASGEPEQPKPAMVPLTRYHHPDGAHFSATKKIGPPPGFTSEGVFGSLVATAEPGTRKFYACKVTGQNDWFTSTDQSGNCEGQQTIGLLGYAYANPPTWASARAIYRCNAGGSHFDSLSAGCEGKTKEFLMGYLVF
ncbi:Serine/threonine protein kinase [Amycolatopsis tolypomycina]|uniref:non-specific serine/threonine protein kinase n=1 Tax=Amycolatopsis tolypomycina TaxID=208445 RepID=A0A1H4J6N7_9PSEU|nr:serine/threonine-protein kinase [Amycolatopsis tolypomycina]SEB41999.1 Serine/threonine protein kinase [Amycolatopsis tolypomycina]